MKWPVHVSASSHGMSGRRISTNGFGRKNPARSVHPLEHTAVGRAIRRGPIRNPSRSKRFHTTIPKYSEETFRAFAAQHGWTIRDASGALGIGRVLTASDGKIVVGTYIAALKRGYFFRSNVPTSNPKRAAKRHKKMPITSEDRGILRAMRKEHGKTALRRAINAKKRKRRNPVRITSPSAGSKRQFRVYTRKLRGPWALTVKTNSVKHALDSAGKLEGRGYRVRVTQVR